MSSKQTEVSADLLAAIDLWLRWDQCQETRDEIAGLRSSSNWKELEDRLVGRIQFGTAGLRSSMGAGFTRMNELTVIETTQGLVRYIESKFAGDSTRVHSVVVGFDGRRNSHRFARLVASLFLHERFRVYLFDSRVVPTPFVPFAVKKLGCLAGIMITASHNPKEDNGYKLYWSNGAQIIPPMDVEISQSIEANLEPWTGKAWNCEPIESKRNDLLFDPLDEIVDVYMEQLSSLSFFPSLNETSQLKLVYTPVHGVGQFYAEKAFDRFHFRPFISVDEQKEVDADFPTVKYPNPEEGKETLECSIRTGLAHDADYILANDPDADRFAVAERDRETQTWTVLSGNQLGALLGWWRWFTWRNKNPEVEPADVFMLYSTVSSHFLKSMSAVEGFQTIETLTGFKWLGNRAEQLIDDGKRVLFAFEEAIGFMCDPDNVLDKDGISALVVGAEMIVYLNSIGRTLLDQIDELSLVYGFHFNNNSYLICRQTQLIKKIFDKIRKSHRIDEESIGRRSPDRPAQTRATFGRWEIVRIRDLTVGVDVQFDQGRENIELPSLPCSKSTEMITFYFNNGSEITIRASGTEPKIKWYSEIRKSFAGETSIDSFRRSTREELDQLVGRAVEAFLEPDKNGLTRK